MIEEGAQIIDIGAESTKPGSDPISYKEEIRKLSPILKKLPKDKFLISVDSSKIETQEFALENGAHIINDIFGGSNDLFDLTKKYKNGLVLMHTPAPPKIMQSKVNMYKNVVYDIKNIFLSKIPGGMFSWGSKKLPKNTTGSMVSGLEIASWNSWGSPLVFLIVE